MRHTASIVTALALAACSRSEPATAVASEVGERCLDCHGEIVRSYRRTGMARATGPVEPGELQGLEPVRDGDGGWSYAFVDVKEISSGPALAERWKDAPLRF